MRQASQIEAEASAWLAKRDAGEWCLRDDLALEQWIAASTANRIAYLRLQTAWTKADRLRAIRRGGAISPSNVRRRFWIPSTAVLTGGLAAALAAAFAVIMFTGGGAQYATPVGGFQRLPPLVDGSRIELNTDTKIKVAFGDRERLIELDQGEAFFSVEKDDKRPFIVDAGAYRVIAVGTAFSVQRRSEGIEVIVTEGRVRIEPDSIEIPIATPTFVSAGQGVDIDEISPVMAPIAKVELSRHLSWREGVLIFDNQPLRDAVTEFNRYNEQKLVVADAKVGAVTIGGRFRPTNLAGFTRLLKPGFGIEAVPVGDRRILLRFAQPSKSA